MAVSTFGSGKAKSTEKLSGSITHAHHSLENSKEEQGNVECGQHALLLIIMLLFPLSLIIILAPCRVVDKVFK
jgi:hypothetical protein